MRRNGLLASSLMIAAMVTTGCERTPVPPDIPFANSENAYSSKVDFARVEHDMPLSREALDTITPENLEALTQEQVDQVYARLTAGPIPDGAFKGTFFFAEGGGARRIAEIMGGLKGVAVNVKLDLVNNIGERLWKGKVFYRDERVLRNMITERRYMRVLDLDPDTIEQTEIEGQRSWLFFPKKAWLVFPAKLYCGQSLLDGRRESIIIDYAFNDQIEGYQPKLDYLVGRHGLYIRDEIRMIRPGFYLGRAYFGRVFGMNFTLYNEDVAAAGYSDFMAGKFTEEDCWTGTQQHGAVAVAP